MSKTPLALLISATLLLSAALAAQKPKNDISSVVAAGSVNGDVYTNTYFRISVSAPKAHFTAPSFVNAPGKRARLVQVVYDSGDGALNDTIAVLADSVENYPKDMPVGVYVRSVRHQLEKEGLITAREEFPTLISGVPFIGAILKVPEKPNFGYFRGIYSTFLNGYVVSIEVQGRNEERINQTLSSGLKIEPKTGAHVQQ